MMGLKRKLFPERSEFPVMHTSEARRGERSAHDCRKRKRNATKVVLGDSLGAIALNEKENTLPTNTRKGVRQAKDAYQSKQKDIQNLAFEPSVLMALGTKENNNTKSLTTKSTRQQNDNSGKKSKTTKNRRMQSRKTGSILVCFDNNYKSASSSRIKGNVNISKSTHGKVNEKTKTTGKRTRKEDEVTNGDSLMTCLAENSTKSKTTRTKSSKKQTKSVSQRKKRNTKCKVKNQSQVSKSTKPQQLKKRHAVTSCNVGGLGAFVGIMGDIATNENLVEESRNIRRMVLPIEIDLKNNAGNGSNIRKKSTKQRSKKTQKEAENDVSELDQIPSMIILSLPDETEQSQLRLSFDTVSSMGTKWKVEHDRSPEKPIAESSKTERLRHPPSPKILSTKKDSKQKESISKDCGNKSDKKSCNDTKPRKGCNSGGCAGGQTADDSLKTNDKNSFLDNGGSSDTARAKKQHHKLSVEQKKPLRRSRRRSHEPIRLIDDAQASTSVETQKSDSSTSFRRSKRRKSQPIRLIDLENSETQEAPKSTGNKKAKRSKKKPEIENKQKSTQNDKQSKIDEVEEAIDIAITNVSNRKRRSSSPSTRDKEQFDDALKAVMPTDDTDQLQDDIFNSTPMRTLFGMNLSTSMEDKTSDRQEGKSKQRERRSRRKSIEPERFGYDTESVTNSSVSNSKSDSETKPSKKNTRSDSETKSLEKDASMKSTKNSSSVSASKPTKKHTKSALKKSKRKTKGSLKSKKRVRISLEPPGVTTFESDGELKEIDQWSKGELRSLHRAHRLVDPRSFSFWEDVSELIGDRSALECRQKWFSLAKTPEPKKPKQRKQINLKIDTTVTNQNVDDDIFNSTPMRSAFAIGENIDMASTAFEELGEFSKMDVGSAFKINMIEQNNETEPSNEGQISCPHGYKTYLQKMGRVMRQKDTRKKHTSEVPGQHALPIGKKLAERIEEGDVQVKGRLSPGGTLRVDTFGDTDTEDYLLGYEEDEEETE